MKHISFSFLRDLPVKRLVAEALEEIERSGYSRRSRGRYRAVWEHLVEFAGREEFGDVFSEELAARFLEVHRVGEDELGPGEGWRRHVVWGVKVLADFAKDRQIQRSITEVQSIQLEPAMQNTLREYQRFCKDRLHVRPVTIDRRTRELTLFLDFVHSRKGRTLRDIQALDLSEFLSYRDHWRRSRSRESSRTCVLFFGFSRCAGSCRRISV